MIFDLLASNQVKTPVYKFRATFTLQHTAAKSCDGQITSISAKNFLLAYHLSSSALTQLQLQQDMTTIKRINMAKLVALN